MKSTRWMKTLWIQRKDDEGMSRQEFTIHVQHMEKLPRGRVKVKIAETYINLTNMKHQGIEYTTISNLGRGRYVMRAGASSIATKVNRGMK